MSKIPVILDTDIGTDIDDTWALTMLLNCPELDLRLINTVSGDTTYRAHLTAKFLQAAGRTEIPIGIGLGSPEGSLNFQQPWLDGFDVDSYPGTIYPDGVQAMLEVIAASPQPVTVISIGVATNIARALERNPDIASKCRFVGMHGSVHLGYGGAPGAVPEANVRYDVQALRNVFAAPWLEKIITPLDTCGLVVLEGERYQKVYRSQNPALRALIENYEIWSKLVTWMTVDYTDSKSSTLFDTVAIYLAYSFDLLEMENIRLRITDDGLTLPDPAGDEVLAALRWRDLDAFYDHLLERLKP
ncbi:MAG: nucleoside hydrolase [Anaerolineae bacterium]|nr:MAG: nucleoside hydrolase [Anaerolineae bacterium]